MKKKVSKKQKIKDNLAFWDVLSAEIRKAIAQGHPIPDIKVLIQQ